MLEVFCHAFNPFQENTYVIANEEKECWIVDPGMMGPDENARMKAFLESRSLRPQAIINTHAHIDHVLGVAWLQQHYPIPFHVHEKDQPVLDATTAVAARYGLPNISAPHCDSYLPLGKGYRLGKDEVEIRFAPGHSPGSVVFYYEPGGWVIAGDVLFLESVGRTDLPGGDTQTLMKSIQEQLYTLPAETKVYPGHGPATTIGHERANNPYVR